jgi:hypothetical protein
VLSRMTFALPRYPSPATHIEPSCGGGGECVDEYRSAIANIASRRIVGMRRRRRLNGDEEVEELADVGEPGELHVVCLHDNGSIKPL